MVTSSAGVEITMGSWETVQRLSEVIHLKGTPIQTHLHPQRLTSALTERPLRCLLDLTTPAPFSTTASLNVGEVMSSDSWETGKHRQGDLLGLAHLRPQRLTSARAERLLRCVLEVGTPVPFSTTARPSAGDAMIMDSWATVEA